MNGRAKVSWRQWLVAILLVSALLRVAIALYYGDAIDMPRASSDQVSYHALATRLASGHGYSFDSGWYPFTPANTPTAHWSYLYTALVAGVYLLFGPHPLAVRLIQAVLGGLALPWMVCRLTQRLFPRREALAVLAAAATACYAYFALYAAMLMTETLFIVLVLWSLEASLRLRAALQAGTGVPWRVSAELGLSLGLAVLTRQSYLPWAPVLFVALFCGSGGWRRLRSRALPWATIKALLLTGGLLLACIIPFTVRNYIVYDRLLLLNSNTGYAMYSAQHPMHGTHFREFDAAPLPDDLQGHNEVELNRELMRRGIQFVLDEPGRYALLSLSRVRALFEFWPTDDTSLLHNVGRVLSFGLYLPFMLVGVVAACRRYRSADIGLVLLFMVFYCMLHILTWAMVRYRLPVDAAAMPFAALGLACVLPADLRRKVVGEPCA